MKAWKIVRRHGEKEPYQILISKLQRIQNVCNRLIPFRSVAAAATASTAKATAMAMATATAAQHSIHYTTC